MTRYRRTQFGTLTVVSVGGAIALLVVISARTGWHPISIIVLAILAVALVLFCTLTIEIGGSRLLCFFGPGLIRKTFGLSDIVAARTVRNKWYYGWGVRLTPSGWMFNVSGLDAVELELISGKRFRIGTDQPEELTAAIRQATGSPSTGAEPISP
jgi:hypothetical protein